MTDFLFPATILSYGFVNYTGGTHGSRTLMLKELRLLFAACPPDRGHAAFRQAIVEENVLRKRMETTRRKSFRRLRDLYGLDEAILLFRSLRAIDSTGTSGQLRLQLRIASPRYAPSPTGRSAMSSPPTSSTSSRSR